MIVNTTVSNAATRIGNTFGLPVSTAHATKLSASTHNKAAAEWNPGSSASGVATTKRMHVYMVMMAPRRSLVPAVWGRKSANTTGTVKSEANTPAAGVALIK